MNTNLALWQDVLAIVHRPGGWPLALLAALLIALLFVALLWLLTRLVAWLLELVRLRITVRPPVRIDEEFARRDREARTYAADNRLRSLSAPAPKGYERRPIPFPSSARAPRGHSEALEPAVHLTPAPASIISISAKGH